MLCNVGRTLLLISLLLLAFETEAARSKTGSFQKYEMMTGKIKRTYWVFIPDIIKDAKKMSAVLAFHGKDMTAEKFHKFLDPGLEASDYAFMMVYPQARDNHWRAGRGAGVKSHWADDETFAIELIKKLVKEHKADPDRIFTMGYSSGAQMSTKLACNHADKIYAAASVANSMNEWGCNPSHEISMIYIQGIKDPIVPYKGGGKYRYSSHLESVNFFREVNGITSAARVVKVNDSLKCRHYSQKKRSTFVIGCRLYEEGHHWPGSKGHNKTYGPKTASLDTNYFILRRFYKLKTPKVKRDQTKIVSHGSINAGMTTKKLAELREVRKARYRKTMGITADQQGAQIAKAKADAASRKKAKLAQKIKKPASPGKAATQKRPMVASKKPSSNPKTQPATQSIATKPASSPSVASQAIRAPKPAAQPQVVASASRGGISKFSTVKSFTGKHGAEARVLVPKFPIEDRSVRPSNTALRESDYNLLVFITPPDVTTEQAIQLVNAEARMFRHNMLFAHVASSGKVDQAQLFAMQELLETIEVDFGLDRPPRYAIGYSSGGELLQQLYCQAPASFQAMASVGYSWRQGQCSPIPRLPLLVMQSKADPRFAFKQSTKERFGHNGLIQFMRSSFPDLLVSDMQVSKVDHRCTAWSEPGSEPVLVSCTQDWGGNTIPGAGATLASSYGKTMNGFDAPAYIYSFLARQDESRFNIGRQTFPLVSR